MSVIVFNKRTGKYLRRHSGSYRDKWDMLRYKKNISEEIKKRFGGAPEWSGNREAYYKYHVEVNRFLKDMICDAEPEDARVYASRGSALTSVGVLDRNRKDRVYKLPDYLEIHEIKEAFVCVMRPDGSSNCDDKDAK